VFSVILLTEDFIVNEGDASVIALMYHSSPSLSGLNLKVTGN
jgi:hypothetical protein